MKVEVCKKGRMGAMGLCVGEGEMCDDLCRERGCWDLCRESVLGPVQGKGDASLCIEGGVYRDLCWESVF